MSTAETVALASLEASVSLESHVQYLSTLLDLEVFDSRSRAGWNHRLEKARQRHQDPNLYIAVVGESCSGKSTLINALIREPLLPEDVLPATTASIVLVRSGSELRLQAQYLDGHQEDFRNEAVTRDRLEQLSTDEETARTLSFLSLEHPACRLPAGFVAVDLPGSNVENTRHHEVTGNAVRDFCDAALVAIPSRIPASESLVEFLQGQLGDRLHRCIFVITKLDQLSPGDTELVLATVAARLALKLGTVEPWVLGVSASTFLGLPLADGTAAPTLGPAGARYRALQAQFLDAEQRILGFFQARGPLIRLERSSAIAISLLEAMQGDLQNVLEHRRTERETTQSLPELAPFLAEGRIHHGQDLQIRLQALEDELLRSLSDLRQSTLQSLWNSLAAANRPARAASAASFAADTLMAEASVSLQRTQEAMLLQVGPQIHSGLAAFEAELLERYRSVPVQELRLSGAEFQPSIPARGARWSRPKPVQAKRLENKRVLAMASGAVAGVFAGFMLFGLLGTIGISEGEKNSCCLALLALFLGPFAGAYWISRASVPIDAVRKAYWADLFPSLELYFTQAGSAASLSFQEAQRAARASLDGWVNRSAALYGTSVRDAIAHLQSRAEESLRTERRIAAELSGLERRQADLRQIRARLAPMQKL
jgi:Dynamin family